MKVWVVTYRKHAVTPIVTVWDNREAAEKHFLYLSNNDKGSLVTLDEAPIHHIFEIVNDGKEKN